MNGLTLALAAIGRRFIGGYGTATSRKAYTPTRYYPHQSKREMERRVRQMKKEGA